MTGQWLAGGALLLSFILALGWAGFDSRKAQAGFWREAERRGGRLAPFFYYVGLPYLAIIFGILPTRMLGLKGLEHFALIQLTGGISTATVAELQSAASLMLFEWLLDIGPTLLPSLLALITLGGITYGLARTGISQTTPQLSLSRIIYYGLHWAFYRAIFWRMTDDLYLGIVLGTQMVILELILMAYLQKTWPDQQPQILMTFIILILTSSIFFYSPNLWLLWVIHWLMVVLVTGINLAYASTEIPVEQQ